MIEHEVVIFARPSLDEDKGYRFIIVSPELKWITSPEDIELKELTVLTPELEHTKGELALKAVHTLKERQQRKRAEAEQECMQLQEKIDKLLLLPYLPDGVRNA